jgi:hypothetical protein
MGASSRTDPLDHLTSSGPNSPVRLLTEATLASPGYARDVPWGCEAWTEDWVAKDHGTGTCVVEEDPAQRSPRCAAPGEIRCALAPGPAARVPTAPSKVPAAPTAARAPRDALARIHKDEEESELPEDHRSADQVQQVRDGRRA